MVSCPVLALPLTGTPLRDRPWERAWLGLAGLGAQAGLSYLRYQYSIGTVNTPSAILLTSGSRGRKSSSHPSPRRPSRRAAVPMPAGPANPSQSPWPSPPAPSPTLSRQSGCLPEASQGPSPQLLSQLSSVPHPWVVQ